MLEFRLQPALLGDQKSICIPGHDASALATAHHDR